MKSEDKVLLHEEKMLLPTYPIGEPDKNPMFLEKRVYQGSSGKVYPLPVIDKIYDDKFDQEWNVIVLENRYLLIWIMPELGGRIQRALDKTNQYDFVYYNHVIKPALVGLAGPWISGGIEFNWPQHHRPDTYSPVDYLLRENADGSKTVLIGDIDEMFGTKSTVAFTLRPDRAYLEINAQLYNGTGQPQTFLWWANPAYAVNEQTQLVFPPDVHAVFDHGKRDVSRFPIATGTYYKMDYSAGVDISRYKNIPVPTSYMAYHSDFNFVGGYDNGRRAGLLHVADRHVSPGKKQWTWGCGDFGRAWDRNLTDADGPYIELMTGVYTDNQPDFSWLNPYEEKSFTQYFMPYKNIGVVKNASRDIALNLEAEDGKIRAFAYASSPVVNAKIVLQGKETVYVEKTFDLSPELVYEEEFAAQCGDAPTDLTLSVYNAQGDLLLRFTPLAKKHEKMPDPAKTIPAPRFMANNEALFLAGLHLEQYRHATYDPEAYYLEGLRRDPSDSRINNAYGMLLIRRGQFKKAEECFRSAIETLTRHNPNPYDSEPYYNLGLALKYQGEMDGAYDAFFKSCWSAAMQCQSYYAVAAIDCMRGEYATAFEHVERSILYNGHNLRARGLKTALCRKLGRDREAAGFARKTLAIDPFDLPARYELYLSSLLLVEQAEVDGDFAVLERLMRTSRKNKMELAVFYLDVGLYDEAYEVLNRFGEQNGACDPLADYYMGWLCERLGNLSQRDFHYAKGAAASPLYCFPNRLYDILVLQSAQTANFKDARAFYYLGNLWYDRRQIDKAVECFERAVALDPSYPTVHRNLALAYYNKLHDPGRARRALEKAFALDETDARVFFELDQLYKKLCILPAQRLTGLEQHMNLVEKRDDLYVEYITLLNISGRCREVEQKIASRKFHPWEGGEGKITKQYVQCKLALSRQFLAEKRYLQAVEILQQALVYPENLGEGKLYGAQENDIYYFLGLAYEKIGDTGMARECYQRASVGLAEPASAMFYNDQPPETIFYQGLALQKLGEPEMARSRFHKLIDYGEKHLADHVEIDYFAVSLPDFLIFDEDLDRKNIVHCRYLIGLGYLGLGSRAAAKDEFELALKLAPEHQGLLTHMPSAEKITDGGTRNGEI